MLAREWQVFTGLLFVPLKFYQNNVPLLAYPFQQAKLSRSPLIKSMPLPLAPVDQQETKLDTPT